MTTLAALLNLEKALLCLVGWSLRSSGDGYAPILAIKERVACSQSWKPPRSRRRYFFW